MKIEIVGEDFVYRGEFISVMKKIFVLADGPIRAWDSVKRNTFGKIVSIFALTENREVILERIFRIPHNSYIIELPAGLMDKKGETPEDAIRRELLEETGYAVSGELISLIEGPFNAGLTDDELIIFFTKGAKKVSEQRLEGVEDITVFLVPIDDFVDFVMKPPPDTKVDLKVLSALPILQKKGLI